MIDQTEDGRKQEEERDKRKGRHCLSDSPRDKVLPKSNKLLQPRPDERRNSRARLSRRTEQRRWELVVIHSLSVASLPAQTN
jgi:hypothetical protein